MGLPHLYINIDIYVMLWIISEFNKNGLRESRIFLLAYVKLHLGMYIYYGFMRANYWIHFNHVL